MKEPDSVMVNFLVGLIALFGVLFVMVTVLLLAMVFWGLVFCGFDWVFPNVIARLVPDALSGHAPFSIGAMFGIVYAFFNLMIRRHP